MTMDDKALSEYIDQQRWLFNNGLVPESVKNQLFFGGSIVHKDVKAVETKIVVDSKLIEYVIYFDKSMLKKIDTYKSLSTSQSLFGMWRFKRFLKREGSLDFKSILSTFVADFCGPKWSVKVKVSDYDTYIDGIGAESERDKTSPAAATSEQSDQLPL